MPKIKYVEPSNYFPKSTGKDTTKTKKANKTSKPKKKSK